jgi:hypothetical protein
MNEGRKIPEPIKAPQSHSNQPNPTRPLTRNQVIALCGEVMRDVNHSGKPVEHHGTSKNPITGEVTPYTYSEPDFSHIYENLLDNVLPKDVEALEIILAFIDIRRMNLIEGIRLKQYPDSFRQKQLLVKKYDGVIDFLVEEIFALQHQCSYEPATFAAAKAGEPTADGDAATPADNETVPTSANTPTKSLRKRQIENTAERRIYFDKAFAAGKMTGNDSYRILFGDYLKEFPTDLIKQDSFITYCKEYVRRLSSTPKKKGMM